MNEALTLGLLVVAVGTIAFEAMVFGEDLVESSIFTTIEYGDCSTGDFFDVLGCVVLNFFKGLVNTVLIVSSVIRFLFNALTFNIPGAPMAIRIVVSSVFIGGIGFAIVSMVKRT